MPNLPHRIREAHEQHQGPLWVLTRQIHVAMQMFTPSVGFGLVLHALFGLAFITAALQRKVDVTAYNRLTHGHPWALGVVYLLLYLYALAFPVWGGLIAVFAYSTCGMASAILDTSILGIIFYLGLPYVAFRTTRKKEQLLAWVVDRRADYDRDAVETQRIIADLATVTREAADLATANRETAADLATVNRAAAADLATSNRAIATDLSRTNQSQRRDLARQLRECQRALAEARGHDDRTP